MNHFFSEVRACLPEPGRTFLETEDGRRLTYGDMLLETGRLANLIAENGIQPGKVVAAQVEKSLEAALLHLACIRSGTVFLPLNPAYTKPELEYFFSDAQPGMVICSPDRESEVRSIAGKARVETLGARQDGSLVANASRQTSDFEDAPCGPDDLAAILYTSGTTGRSKGAMLTHGNLASNARALVDSWRFTKADVLIHALPIFHTHGLFVGINVTLFSGASMLFLPRFDPDQIVAALPRATTVMGVPTFYVRLLRHPGISRGSFRHMRLCVSGSAPLLKDTFEAWRERTGHTILERYGMTETCMNTSNPYDGSRMPGSVGTPLPGVEVRVCDSATGTQLGIGEVGMIEVRGPNVFHGYWKRPDATAAAFRDDGFFITGDLGKRDERGYLYIVGRVSDVIITGGFNVYPKEVETEIDSLPGVAESAVIGLPHGDLGEAVTAVVATNGARLEEAEILTALQDRLAKYKLPKRAVLVEALPRNVMGKVQKTVLRRQYQDLYLEGTPGR